MPKIFYSESQLNAAKTKTICDAMLDGLLCRVCRNSCVFMEQNEHWEVHCTVRGQAVACHPSNKHAKVVICTEFDNVDAVDNDQAVRPDVGGNIIQPN